MYITVMLSRFFATSIEGLDGRAELLGCLKGGAYSQTHVGLSKELALANPELTLPMFCGEMRWGDAVGGRS